MKTPFILFCSVLLAPMVARSQGGPATIFISTATKPASAGKDTKGFADYFGEKFQKPLFQWFQED